MRVIGGTFGGRRLRSLEGRGTRPTSDRVREALFSRIEARYGLSGAWVLDVFAGTGALAIEALSRGARRAVCIEFEKRARETLRGNLRDLELSGRARVIGDDYRRVLARLGGESGQDVPARAPGSIALTTRADAASGGEEGMKPALASAQRARKRFDGIFIDPPYGKGLAVDALGAVATLGLVKPGGWVTLETGRREQTPEVAEGSEIALRRVREDGYGDTKLALYEAVGLRTQDGHAGESGLPAAEVER